ncbi:MAG: KpsF/GutQ family sugar-phosphate isomerase [Caedimonadaceae bacterium]|nr:MAG: KpsF/GutQ family sugar-phosphate isomerase [Caedimonadaceae bacterium]
MTHPIKNLDDANLFNEDIKEAQRVLLLEAQALETVAENLDSSFSDAISLLLQTKDRIAVTGIGKSGHVARKIAATLSSTGSPSLYIHPAEASHGDLGMITGKDVLIALSNSGETTELSDILQDAKRRQIPLIAITSNPDSSLAKIANISLVLPKFQEACPLQLAPTTSTTLMMALGDALATTLLKRRQFTSIDFKALHPGGRLGQKLKHVSDLMHTYDESPLVSEKTLMQEALLVMTSKKFGCVGVLKENSKELVGVITDGDLRRNLSGNLLTRQASEIMTKNPILIRDNALAEEAIGLMNEKGITSLFVFNEDFPSVPIGILHIHDCLRAGIT